MKKFVGIATILTLGLALAAQDKPAEKKGHEHGGMQPPAPPAEMQKFIQQFEGAWSTHEKHEPSPMMPQGGEGKGTATFKPGPGGNSIIETYKSQSPMGTFEGHGVVWWDAKAGGYRSVWCDVMAPSCDVSEGVSRWTGDTMVNDPEEVDMGGQKMWMAGKFTDITPNSFTFTMDMGPAKDQLKPTMTIHYTKTAAAKAKGAGTKK